MIISVAGRMVNLGDRLYHVTMREWADVIRVEDTLCECRIVAPNGGEYKFFCGPNGIVNGRRELYWHPPLQLDVAWENIAKIQQVVDTMAGQGE